MVYEHKDNTGNLFKVPADQVKSDRHPPYEGEFKLVCPHCAQASTGWVKGWVRETKAGSKYFALAFKNKTKGA